jgi:hypothetical protein
VPETGRAEYYYTRLDTIRNARSDDNPGPLLDTDVEQHTVRAGVSYAAIPYTPRTSPPGCKEGIVPGLGLDDQDV